MQVQARGPLQPGGTRRGGQVPLCPHHQAALRAGRITEEPTSQVGRLHQEGWSNQIQYLIFVLLLFQLLSC